MTNKPVFFNCLIKLEFGNNGFCGGDGEGGVGEGIGFLKYGKNLKYMRISLGLIIIVKLPMVKINF